MTAPVLQFEEITKEYRSFRGRPVKALDGFSLGIQPGEIFGFLGPNGAGKTTAIHLALGFMRATSGHGTMLGLPFGDAPTRARVGFLAENVALYHRPASDVVKFYGALNGIPEPALAARTREMLDLVGLTEVAKRNVKKFSRGMLQRVGLAQALVNDPDLLILDEPTSALDPVARAMVREVLLAARAAGKTIFLSSHLLSEVEAVCDRVAIIVRGRVVRLGTTSSLLDVGNASEVVIRGADGMSLPHASCNDGARQVRVPATDQRRFIESVWAAGGEVVSVTPAKRSLEELFLELARQQDGEVR
jgi:ABC-2 type transport system ATP-binding protein